MATTKLNVAEIDPRLVKVQRKNGETVAELHLSDEKIWVVSYFDSTLFNCNQKAEWFATTRIEGFLNGFDWGEYDDLYVPSVLVWKEKGRVPRTYGGFPKKATLEAEGQKIVLRKGKNKRLKFKTYDYYNKGFTICNIILISSIFVSSILAFFLPVVFASIVQPELVVGLIVVGEMSATGFIYYPTARYFDEQMARVVFEEKIGRRRK